MVAVVLNYQTWWYYTHLLKIKNKQKCEHNINIDAHIFRVFSAALFFPKEREGEMKRKNDRINFGRTKKYLWTIKLSRTFKIYQTYKEENRVNVFVEGSRRYQLQPRKKMIINQEIAERKKNIHDWKKISPITIFICWWGRIDIVAH